METTCLIALHRNPLDNWNKVFEVHLLAEQNLIIDNAIFL
jgi:hypothetical protein